MDMTSNSSLKTLNVAPFIQSFGPLITRFELNFSHSTDRLLQRYSTGLHLEVQGGRVGHAGKALISSQ
eukprot:scaffold518883_cov26-Prasinocladus_malaysianus.AAC.1